MPYQPTHRRMPSRRRSHVRMGAAVAVAALVTGGVVAAGTLTGAAAPREAVASLTATSLASLSAEELAEREQRVSRSTERAPDADTGKSRQLASKAGVSRTASRDLRHANPKVLARALMPEYGLSAGEFSCLDDLWESDSGWSTTADNPTSSAYGIPQALPGEKMSSAGSDWASNPETQIRWGLGYIRDRYGSGCGAWPFKSGNNWY